jgi:hypothetical protein
MSDGGILLAMVLLGVPAAVGIVALIANIHHRLHQDRTSDADAPPEPPPAPTPAPESAPPRVLPPPPGSGDGCLHMLIGLAIAGLLLFGTCLLSIR